LNLPKIICLSGRAECGKDQFVKFINEIEPVKRVAYGDHLKYIASQYYNWSGRKDIEGRQLLNTLGDKIRKNNLHYFINYCTNLVKDVFVDEKYIFITDARFPIEIDCWKDLGFEVISIKITRINHESILTQEQLNHQTETSMDRYDFDYEIINDSTDNYREYALQLWEIIKGGKE
jgi:hypothetical protein